MIKNLIFDLGGVCFQGHFLRNFSKNLREVTNIDEDSILKAFIQFDAPYEVGDIRPEEFWTQFRAKLDLSLDVRQLQEIFINTSISNDDVLAMIQQLKKKYRTILLTNNYEDMYIKLDKQIHFKKYFHYEFASCFLGIKKPDERIFRHVYESLGLVPSECVFIDDQDKNVHVAKKLGMFSIKFENIKQLRRELILIGVHLL